MQLQPLHMFLDLMNIFADYLLKKRESKENISLGEIDDTCHVTSISSNGMSCFDFQEKIFTKWKSTFMKNKM